MSSTLLSRFKRAIERCHWVDRGERLVVAVSGGVDSMVLLHLFNACRQDLDLSLVVGHVNHGLRPTESDREAELVEAESRRLGLPFESARFETKDFQKAGGLSAQDAARRLRFNFFNELLVKTGAQKIALGHNADDQVETVLLNLLRGAGLKGLRGMLPVREGRVIRPLLEFWRSEIESHARHHQVPYLLDSSNLRQDYVRNRVRLGLIPYLEQAYQPKVKAVLLKTSALLRAEDDYLEREAEKAHDQVVREREDGFSFEMREFQSLHEALRWRVLQKMLARLDRGARGEGTGGLDTGSISRRLDAPPPSFVVELPSGVCLEKRYGTVLLTRGGKERIPPFEVELVVPGRTVIEALGMEVSVEEMSLTNRFEKIDASPRVALMDFHRVQMPLRMRNFRPGDRFRPLGLRGTQKLKAFFIDHKIPRQQRPSVPLLLSGDMIAWVAGHRIDERVKVTEATRKVLRVEVRPSGEPASRKTAQGGRVDQ